MDNPRKPEFGNEQLAKSSTSPASTPSATNYSNLTAHDLAGIFPLMDENSVAFKAFADDLFERGQDNPIWLYEGKILDGRNRYTAMKQKGQLSKLVVQHYTGDDPIGFVLAANLHRRHLNESQRAMVAARVANINLGENQHNSKGKMSIARAAKALNVSSKSVDNAKAVLKSGNTELIEKVTQGKQAVSAAANALKDNGSKPADTSSKSTPSKTGNASSGSDAANDADAVDKDRDEKQDELAASDAVDEIEEKHMDALKALQRRSSEKAKDAVDNFLRRLEDANLLEKKVKRKAA
jgi:hypothetical protein